MEEFYKNITEHLITLETSLHRRRSRTPHETQQFAVSVKFIVDRMLLAFTAHPHAHAKISKDRNRYVQSRYAIHNLSYRTTYVWFLTTQQTVEQLVPIDRGHAYAKLL